MLTLFGVAAIGLLIGFLGGLLGKGGSAIATPMLHAIGIPAIVAVASPLPATIPSTLAAGYAYSRQRLVDWRVVRWSIGFGAPATVAGAYATRWVSGGALVTITDGVLVALGIRLLAVSRRSATRHDLPASIATPDLVAAGAGHATNDTTDDAPAAPPVRGAARAAHDRCAGSPDGRGAATSFELAAVSIAVGLAAGLLANSGGFLLAPLYMTVLRMPIKPALASSLAVASVLAVPGTIVHASLGHIDWLVVGVFATTSVPLSFLGARVALRTDPQRLERLYGGALVVLGAGFLLLH